MSNQSLLVRIVANAQGYVAGIGRADSATRRFGTRARAEFAQMKSMATSLYGQLAGLGVAVGFAQMAKDSAEFERDMRQLQVNLGASRDEMEAWRREAYDNQKRYGTLLADQKELADSLQAAGLDLTSIRAAAEPVAKTLAVAKTNADQLGRAMGVAKEQFGIDISDSRMVSELLDKMVVAGRLGNAELENLPDIFARVGGRAKEANFTLDETLALTEALSKSEPQADRLATLVDSTLRMFTNGKYMQDATEITGVQFFDVKGARRNPLDVIKDIKIAYDKLTTEAERHKFIDSVLGKTDQDTYRGFKKALEDGTMAAITQMHTELQNASGTVEKDLATAMDNAVTQVNRLKGALKESVEDGFARPLGDGLSAVIKKLMDSKEEGGWGLSGNEMLAGGAAAAAGIYAAGRIGGGLLGKVAGKVGGTAGGVAVGKVLEQTAGVQPVFVVNMPDNFGGGGDLPGRKGPAPEKSGSTTGKIAQPAAASAAGGRVATVIGKAKAAAPTVGSVALAAAPLAAMYGVTRWAGQRERYDQRAQSMVQFSSGLEQVLRKAFGWAGYQTQQERHLQGRARQLQDINPRESQNYQAQYERVKALLDGTAQQSESAIRQAGDAVVSSNQAVSQALISQVGQTKIQGSISISVSAPPTVQVSTTAVGNGNTTLNVGKTNTGAK